MSCGRAAYEGMETAMNPDSSSNRHDNDPTVSETVGTLTVTNAILASLIVLIGGGYIYGRFIYKPEPTAEQMEPYAAEVRQRLEEHADVIGEEAGKLAGEIAPPVADAVYARAQKDYPKYIHALETQGSEFLDNIEKILVAKVKAKYRDYLLAHRDVIKEEFPAHANDKNVDLVLEDFQQTMDRIVERYYLDELRREADRTVALWDEFAPLDEPEANEPSLQEQFVDYLADWSVLAVADTVPPDSDSAPTSEPVSLND